ncbi:hypothetical protein PAXINDRAFT_21444 [Paxillus involutus ATCC 200175]|uniref:Uncharacterized protein n=1 Tax=Paxillus involutus ATCC 200175 TaxID=664439 RepID=A0A0C9STA8_PAXIN|nr:hypothetical protein PAXINDRAFT_21444 [Paxillus involutus ATCC 200175]
MSALQRKYVELIHQTSSKWANWDPPIPVKVGAYGTLSRETGELDVEGNIYDRDFQEELDKIGVRFKIADHQPVDGEIEKDSFIASSGASKGDISIGLDMATPGIANASLKGQWQFEKGRRDALLIMHSPRQMYLPPEVILGHLYKVPKLQDKHLVTSVHVCPAFTIYVSNKSGETISLALVAQGPVATGVTAGGNFGFSWWKSAKANFLREGCDKAGNYCYTPLYALKRRREPSNWWRPFRAGERELKGDELWADVHQPWDPLDEDGEEDPVDVNGWKEDDD